VATIEGSALDRDQYAPAATAAIAIVTAAEVRGDDRTRATSFISRNILARIEHADEGAEPQSGHRGIGQGLDAPAFRGEQSALGGHHIQVVRETRIVSQLGHFDFLLAELDVGLGGDGGAHQAIALAGAALDLFGDLALERRNLPPAMVAVDRRALVLDLPAARAS
jgi:hypothetical protein